MLKLVKQKKVLKDRGAQCLWVHEDNKLIAFKRGGLAFLFNFGGKSFPQCEFWGLGEGKWRVVLDTDREEFGGQGRIASDVIYEAGADGKTLIYSPERTAIVLEKIE